MKSAYSKSSPSATFLSEQAFTEVRSAIKMLENRYIDLANFYKELVGADQDSTKKLLRKISGQSAEVAN